MTNQTRGIFSCCAVALAQHFVQNGRFPQQPRKDSGRERRNTLFWPRNFVGRRPKKCCWLFCLPLAIFFKINTWYLAPGTG